MDASARLRCALLPVLLAAGCATGPAPVRLGVDPATPREALVVFRHGEAGVTVDGAAAPASRDLLLAPGRHTVRAPDGGETVFEAAAGAECRLERAAWFLDGERECGASALAQAILDRFGISAFFLVSAEGTPANPNALARIPVLGLRFRSGRALVRSSLAARLSGDGIENVFPGEAREKLYRNEAYMRRMEPALGWIGTVRSNGTRRCAAVVDRAGTVLSVAPADEVERFRRIRSEGRLYAANDMVPTADAMPAFESSVELLRRGAEGLDLRSEDGLVVLADLLQKSIREGGLSAPVVLFSVRDLRVRHAFGGGERTEAVADAAFVVTESEILADAAVCDAYYSLCAGTARGLLAGLSAAERARELTESGDPAGRPTFAAALDRLRAAEPLLADVQVVRSERKHPSL